MNILMKNVTFADIDEVRRSLAGNENRDFAIASKEDKYNLIRDTLVSLSYRTLRKKEKGEVKACLQQVTG